MSSYLVNGNSCCSEGVYYCYDSNKCVEVCNTYRCKSCGGYICDNHTLRFDRYTTRVMCIKCMIGPESSDCDPYIVEEFQLFQPSLTKRAL